MLVIPARFGADARLGRTTTVQLIVNGDNANTATTVVGYALSLVSALSTRYEIEARLAPATGPALSIEPRIWYNPELRSALFLVPGLIAYIAMLTAVVSTSLSVVREKEAGTMEQVRMAPLGPVPYVFGKTLPYFVISLASATAIVLVAMALFDLPMRGSWLALIAAVSLFLVGALSFGLLISTIAETQQVAFQVALLTSYLPTLMLSGFIFPISSMPAFLQLVTYVVPARYFLVVLRGIVLKGVPLGTFGFELAALAVFALVTLGLASLRLRRQWASRIAGRCCGESGCVNVIIKEFLELRQDPRLFGLVIIAPILQLVMLGYAASTDVHDIPMVVVDRDRTYRKAAI